MMTVINLSYELFVELNDASYVLSFFAISFVHSLSSLNQHLPLHQTTSRYFSISHF